MKFIVASSVLKEKLSKISNLVLQNPIVPILENFKFDITKNQLTITSSNLSAECQISLDIECFGECAICVPSKILLDLLTKLPDQPLTFNINTSKLTIEIISNNGRFNLAGECQEDFPIMPIPAYEPTIFKFDTQLFINTLSSILPFAGIDEMKTNSYGCYIEINKDHTKFIGTNFQIFNKIDIHIQNGSIIESPVVFYIPTKLVKHIISSFSHIKKDEIQITHNKTHITLQSQNIKLSTRLNEHNFVDYTIAFQYIQPNKFSTDTSELIGSIDRVSLANNEIKLLASNNMIEIYANNAAYENKFSEKLSSTQYGEDIDICFNPVLLIQTLKQVQSKELTILYSNFKEQFKIQETTYHQEIMIDKTLLVMPIMPSNT